MKKRNLMFVLVASVTAVNTMAFMPQSNVYAKDESVLVQEKKENQTFKNEFGIFIGVGKQSAQKFKNYKKIVLDISDYSKEDIALEKEMATYSSVLAWRIPGTAEPGGLPPMGLHRVRHD